LDLHIEKIGDLAVIECDGRVVRSEAAFKLREAVTSLRNARIIVFDLSEVPAIEGAGLGMLLFLQGWAHRHNIQFKLSILLDLCVTGWNSSTRLQSSTLLRSMK
jgi:anti-anti-sigma regulatory factor